MSDTNLETSNESYEFVLSSYNTYAKPNETFWITMTLSSTLSYDITNITAKITIGFGASFRTGSLRIDGVSYSSVNVTEFFSIPKNLTVGGSPIVLQFAVTMDDDVTDPVYFLGNLRFSVAGVQTSGVTNELKIEAVNSSIRMTQKTSKKVVVSGETLKYSFVIYNEGNMDHENGVFLDVVPTGTTFVPGSVKIGAKTYASADPNAGFTIPTISAEGSASVSFEVTID